MPTTYKGSSLPNKHTEINKHTTGPGGVRLALPEAGPGPGRGSEGTCPWQSCISGPDGQRPRPNNLHSLVIGHATTTTTTTSCHHHHLRWGTSVGEALLPVPPLPLQSMHCVCRCVHIYTCTRTHTDCSRSRYTTGHRT